MYTTFAVQDPETKSYQLDKELLNKNMKLIKRYVDNNEELELSCLYSVQYLVVISMESPSGKFCLLYFFSIVKLK